VKIEEAIQQKKFISEYQKALINLLYTSGQVLSNNTRVLRPFNISQQQFNILRILRGMHPEPATVKLLTERMLDKMSNASRLVEKLKQKGLVERLTCEHDRRRVDISITAKGLGLVKEASVEIENDMERMNDVLTEEEAQQLSDLLDKVRTHETLKTNE
jgi:DNA-binding MarR family transcriptional regulator